MPWYTEPHRAHHVGTYQTAEELRQEASKARAYGWQLVSVITVPGGLEATFVRVGAAS